MTLDDVGRILATLETTDVTECEIEYGTATLHVLFERTFESAAESAVIRTEELAVSEPETLTVKTSATGIFRQTHPLAASTQSDAPSVRYGQHIGYLEIDSVFCPISAPADGVLKTILPQDGKHVGYGQPVAEIHIDRSEQRGNGRA